MPGRAGGSCEVLYSGVLVVCCTVKPAMSIDQSKATALLHKAELSASKPRSCRNVRTDLITDYLINSLSG